MKKFLIASIVALSIVAFSPQLKAQSQSLGTPTVAAATTATVSSNNVATVTKQQNVVLAFTSRLSAAGTSNLVYTFSRSIDGTYYDAITKYTITIPATGTTTNTYATNLNIGGFQYLRLDSIDNFNSSGVLTNYAIRYSIKPNAP